MPKIPQLKTNEVKKKYIHLKHLDHTHKRTSFHFSISIWFRQNGGFRRKFDYATSLLQVLERCGFHLLIEKSISNHFCIGAIFRKVYIFREKRRRSKHVEKSPITQKNLLCCIQSLRYSHPFSFFFQYDAKMAVPMFFTQSCAIFSKIVAHFFYLLLVKRTTVLRRKILPMGHRHLQLLSLL